MEDEEVIDILRKNKLVPSTNRQLSLFSVSVLSLVTGKLIKNELGFSCRYVGFLGERGQSQAYVNEDFIKKEVTKGIEENPQKISTLIAKLEKDFTSFKNKFFIEGKSINENPQNFMKFISEEYVNYFLILFTYNCFLRYFGSDKEKMNEKKSLFEKIEENREEISKIYPEIESLIALSTNLIGKERGFEGDLLRYFTLREMTPYLKSSKISEEEIEELKNRRESYFYLFSEDKEEVFTNKGLIGKISLDFINPEDKKPCLLKGYPAYPGFIRGFAKVILNNNEASKFCGKDIIITPMTTPDIFCIAKKASAIITDEGGLLCHAAIVAREFGIPCITGTKIATQVLHDGDLIEVDANKGLVKILKKA